MQWEHTVVWACQAPGHEGHRYDSQTELKHHLQQDHADSFMQGHLPEILQQSALPAPDTFSILALSIPSNRGNCKVAAGGVHQCPLCLKRFPPAGMGDGGTATHGNTIQDHLLAHLETIALISLPPPENHGTSNMDSNTQQSSANKEAQFRDRDSILSLPRLEFTDVSGPDASGDWEKSWGDVYQSVTRSGLPDPDEDPLLLDMRRKALKDTISLNSPIDEDSEETTDLDAVKMVLVMGPDSERKDFIRALTSNMEQRTRAKTYLNISKYHINIWLKVIPAHNLSLIGAIGIKIGSKKVVVLDIPTFREGKDSDHEVMLEISRIMYAQARSGIQLRGIIHLHSLIHSGSDHSNRRTVELLFRICGDTALPSVLILPSAISRTTETGISMMSVYATLLDKGSRMERFHGDGESALGFVSQMLTQPRMAPWLQNELVLDKMKVRDTTAGAYLHSELEEELRDFEKVPTYFEERLRKVREDESWTSSLVEEMEAKLRGVKQSIRNIKEDQKVLNCHIQAASGTQDSVRDGGRKFFQELQDLPSALALSNFLDLALVVP